jgi:Bacteriophage baseplate protein W
MDIVHPFHFDGAGRTALTDPDDHIQDMIEQLLLTNPGERVNRPTFGGGLLRMVFEPNNPEVATTLQASRLQASLQQWLGDLVDPVSVRVIADDATLAVEVTYVVRRTGESGTHAVPVGGAA